jgi:hypothetical protein
LSGFSNVKAYFTMSILDTSNRRELPMRTLRRLCFASAALLIPASVICAMGAVLLGPLARERVDRGRRPAPQRPHRRTRRS